MPERSVYEENRQDEAPVKFMIDIGNTRISSAMYMDELLVNNISFVHNRSVTDARLDEVWGGLEKPVQVLASSVAQKTVWDAVSAWIEKRWGILAEQTVPEQFAFGITLAYADPHRLGSDRWAAMIAARHYAPGKKLCVVDSGSAMTIDLLDETGRHLGGYIIPGMEMMAGSLVQQTARIQAEQRPAFELNPGTDTSGCVFHGAFLSQVAMLEYLCQHGYSDAAWLITGGNGVILTEQLSFKVIHQPRLVLEGLKLIADYRKSAC